MTGVLQRAADQVLSRMVSSSPRVPGVVAMVTDRKRIFMKAQRASACLARTPT